MFRKKREPGPTHAQLVRAAIRDECPVCEYSREGLKPGAACPECGCSIFKSASQLPMHAPPGHRIEDLSRSDRVQLGAACAVITIANGGVLALLLMFTLGSILAEWLMDRSMARTGEILVPLLVVAIGIAVVVGGWMLGSERRSTSGVVVKRSWFARLWAWIIPLGMWAVLYSGFPYRGVIEFDAWRFAIVVCYDFCIVMWIMVMYMRLRDIKRSACIWLDAMDALAPAMPASWGSMLLLVFGCRALPFFGMLGGRAIDESPMRSSAGPLIYIAGAAYVSAIAWGLAKELWKPDISARQKSGPTPSA